METNAERKSYPVISTEYELVDEIGHGVSATVYAAKCLPLDEIVAIKSLDLERVNANLDDIRREAQTLSLINHPNVLRAHCSFIVGQNLWVVMPFMAGGSFQSIMKTAFPSGFEEPVIAAVLKETLKALEYLHQQGHIHRDVKAGNILIDLRGGIKVADFGVSACVFESGDRQRFKRNTFVGTPCWMAPEVIDQGNGYDHKADIWSFGITALELAHGHAPFSKFPPMKALLMQLQGAPPGLDYAGDKKFSRSFREMVGLCLVRDPCKRPSAEKLLKHSFFRHAKPPDYLVKHVLENLPSLTERVRMLKAKETLRVKVCEDEDEDIDVIPQARMRRISGWNFNEDNLKFEPMYPFDESMTADQKRLWGHTEDDKNIQKIVPCLNSDACSGGDHLNATNSQADSESNSRAEPHSIGGNLCSRENPNTVVPKNRLSSDSDSNSSPGSNDGDGSRLKSDCDFGSGPADCEMPKEISQPKECTHVEISSEKQHPMCISDKMESASQFEISPEKQHPREIYDKKECTNLGVSSPKQQPHGTDLMKPTNGSEHNNRGGAGVGHGAKPSLVQKKGRFSVTEEGFGVTNKPTIAYPPPPLRRMHSLSSQTCLSSQSLSCQASPTILSAPILPVNESNPLPASASTMIPLLQSLLQSTTVQRDMLFQIMNNIGGGGDPVSSANNGNIPAPVVLEKTETERESDLVQQISELQGKVSSLLDELHVIKNKNAQLEHQLNAIYNKEEEERIRKEEAKEL